MNSDFVNETGDTVAVKKRRLPGACDTCRRKKIKCDSAAKPDGVCTNCAQYGLKCTHGEPVKKRGPKTGASYVQELEQRVNSLEALLHELKPDALSRNPDSELSTMVNNVASPISPVRDTWSVISRSRELTPPSMTQSSTSNAPSPESSTDSQPKEDDLGGHYDLSDHLERLSVKTDRFFGSASTFALAQSAMRIRSEYVGAESNTYVRAHPANWQLQPWERATFERDKPHHVFPPEDLMDHLISIFFANLHPYIPLLHKPTFLESVRQGVHLKDEAFGSLVLLVLATASRHSQDPRVLYSGDCTRTSAGWQFFEQVNVVKNAIYHVPTLYDLQLCVLIVLYSLGTSVPQTAWTIVGVGVRFAVEIGVHRRKAEGHIMTMEDELKKRAFWILLSLDRTICLFLGRPSIIRDEDFDLELPIDCDDEYWIIAPNGEVTFQQPPDKPSTIVFFRQHLKLIEILAFVLTTIYSIKKSRVMLGLTGKDWEQKLVRDLDSALNSWMDQVPDHLRWDPHRENKTHLLQSATLWMVYYLVQIQIHRPFINTDSPLSFSSLAICTNAARSCCHVIDTQYKTVGLHYPYSMFGAFICGIVLSMNIWSGKRSGLGLSLKKEIADVKRCLHILECSSVWWNVAGRLCDMLITISSFGEANLSDSNEVSLKRSREVAGLPEFMTDYNSVADAPSYLLQSVPPGGYHYSDPAMSGMSIADVFAQDAFAGDFNFTPLGNETVDMWSGAPTGFSWEEWGSYIANTDDPLAMS